MTHRRHPRVVTKEQFSASTAIDGTRIDKALQETVDRFNDIPKGDIKRRWVQNTAHAGWTLPRNGFGWGQPYLNHRNVAADVHGAVPEDFPLNEFRAKGVAFPIENANDRQHVVTYRHWFSAPAILHAVHVQLRTDQPGALAPTYTTTFSYGVTPPVPFANGDATRDVGIVIQAASPFRRGIRRADDILARRASFNVKLERYTQGTYPVAADGLAIGAWAGGRPSGFYYPGRDLGIEIPAKTEVQTMLTLPVYADGTNVADWVVISGSSIPWASIHVDVTWFWLEEIVRG